MVDSILTQILVLVGGGFHKVKSDYKGVFARDRDWISTTPLSTHTTAEVPGGPLEQGLAVTPYILPRNLLDSL